MRDARVLVVFAGLAVAALWWALVDAERRGERKAEQRTLAARVDTLWREVHRTDTLYVELIRTATRWRDRWDTVMTRDTITVDSIVYVPLAPADSTIRACVAAVVGCEARVAARDSLIRGLQARLAAQPTPPPAWRVWGERALWMGAGVGVGTLAGRR